MAKSSKEDMSRLDEIFPQVKGFYEKIVECYSSIDWPKNKLVPNLKVNSDVIQKVKDISHLFNSPNNYSFRSDLLDSILFDRHSILCRLTVNVFIPNKLRLNRSNSTIMSESDLKTERNKLTPDYIVTTKDSCFLIEVTSSENHQVIQSKYNKYLQLSRDYEIMKQLSTRVIVVSPMEFESSRFVEMRVFNMMTELIMILRSDSNLVNFITTREEKSKDVSLFDKNLSNEALLQSVDSLLETPVYNYYSEEINTLGKDSSFFPDENQENSKIFMENCLSFLSEKVLDKRSNVYEPLNVPKLSEAVNHLKEHYSIGASQPQNTCRMLQFHLNTSVERFKSYDLEPSFGMLRLINNYFGDEIYRKIMELVNKPIFDQKDLHFRDSGNTIMNAVMKQFRLKDDKKILDPNTMNTGEIMKFLNYLNSKESDAEFDHELRRKLLSYLQNCSSEEVILSFLEEQLSRGFFNKRVYKFLYMTSKIIDTIIFSSSFDLGSEKVVLNNCGYKGLILMTLSGSSFLKNGSDRVYILIQDIDPNCPEKGKNYMELDGSCLNIFSMNRNKAHHLTNGLELFLTQNFYYISDLLGQKEESMNSYFYNEDLQLHLNGIRPLIYLTNSRVLSDLLTNERYIKLNISSYRSCVVDFIREKLKIVVRKQVDCFFVKLMITNLSDIVSYADSRMANRKKVTFNKLRRLFSFGYNIDDEEAITSLYDGYLTSKDRMSDYHCLVNSMKKLIETKSEFKKLLLNEDSKMWVRGYYSKEFDPEQEFELFKKLYESKEKFTAHRWFIYLLARMKANEEFPKDDNFMQHLSMKELTKNISSFATTKSSFEKFNKENFDYIKNYYEKKKQGFSDKEIDQKIKNGPTKKDVSEVGVMLKQLTFYKLKLKNCVNKEGIHYMNLQKKIVSLEEKTVATIAIIDKLFELGNKDIDLYTYCLQTLHLGAEPLISIFSKDQYSSDREIAILQMLTRLKLRLVEAFSESLTKFFPEDVVRDNQKFVTHSNFVKEGRDMMLNNAEKDMHLYFWNLDKTRWGPGLMPSHFASMMEGLLHGRVPQHIVDVLKVILFSFHNKNIQIPNKIIASWMNVKYGIKKTREAVNNDDSISREWESIRKSFELKDETSFNMFPGMMQGLLQQTSSIYHCLKIYLERKILERVKKSVGVVLLHKNLVTSDDSIKVLVSERKSLDYFMSCNYSTGKVLNMYDNSKKSGIHTSVSELNQNFISKGIETGVPIKTMGKHLQSIPSVDYHDVIMHISSSVTECTKKNVSLSSQSAILSVFMDVALRRFGIATEDLELHNLNSKNPVSLLDVPIQLGGVPYYLPMTFKQFGFKSDLCHKVMIRNSVVAKKFLKFGVETDEESEFSNYLPCLRSVFMKKTGINNVRKRLLESYTGIIEKTPLEKISHNLHDLEDLRKIEITATVRNFILRYFEDNILSTDHISELNGIMLSETSDLNLILRSISDLLIKELALPPTGVIDEKKKANLVRLQSRVSKLSKNTNEETLSTEKVFEFFKKYMTSKLFLRDFLSVNNKESPIIFLMRKYFNRNSYKMFDKSNDIKIKILWSRVGRLSFTFTNDQTLLDDIFIRFMEDIPSSTIGFVNSIVKALEAIDMVTKDEDVEGVMSERDIYSRLTNDRNLMLFFMKTEIGMSISNNYKSSTRTRSVYSIVRNPYDKYERKIQAKLILNYYWFNSLELNKRTEEIEEDFIHLKQEYPFLDMNLETTINNLNSNDPRVFIARLEDIFDTKAQKRLIFYSGFNPNEYKSKTDFDVLQKLVVYEKAANLCKGRKYGFSYNENPSTFEPPSLSLNTLCNSFFTGSFLARDKIKFREDFKRFNKKSLEELIEYVHKNKTVLNCTNHRNLLIVACIFDNQLSPHELFSQLLEEKTFDFFTREQGRDEDGNWITNDNFEFVTIKNGSVYLIKLNNGILEVENPSSYKNLEFIRFKELLDHLEFSLYKVKITPDDIISNFIKYNKGQKEIKSTLRRADKVNFLFSKCEKPKTTREIIPLEKRVTISIDLFNNSVKLDVNTRFGGSKTAQRELLFPFLNYTSDLLKNTDLNVSQSNIFGQKYLINNGDLNTSADLIRRYDNSNVINYFYSHKYQDSYMNSKKLKENQELREILRVPDFKGVFSLEFRTRVRRLSYEMDNSQDANKDGEFFEFNDDNVSFLSSKSNIEKGSLEQFILKNSDDEFLLQYNVSDLLSDPKSVSFIVDFLFTTANNMENFSFKNLFFAVRKKADLAKYQNSISNLEQFILDEGGKIVDQGFDDPLDFYDTSEFNMSLFFLSSFIECLLSAISEDEFQEGLTRELRNLTDIMNEFGNKLKPSFIFEVKKSIADSLLSVDLRIKENFFAFSHKANNSDFSRHTDLAICNAVNSSNFLPLGVPIEQVNHYQSLVERRKDSKPPDDYFLLSLYKEFYGVVFKKINYDIVEGALFVWFSNIKFFMELLFLSSKTLIKRVDCTHDCINHFLKMEENQGVDGVELVMNKDEYFSL